MILTKPRTCRECQKPLEKTMKANSEFCCTACRVGWRNRRMSRGADLYDLFMNMRYNRDAAKEAGVWTEMCRLAEQWNDEDKAADRQTFFRADEMIAHLKDRGAIRRGPVWHGCTPGRSNRPKQ